MTDPVIDETSAVVDPTGATEEIPVETESEAEVTVNMDGLEMVTAPNLSTGDLITDKDVMNILLLGTDERQAYFNTNSRSDVIILVSINKKAGTVKLVSFSRGIAAPFMEGQYKGKYEWLTNLHRWGGSKMVMMAIEECFKVECDYFVRVNFSTVKTVVDAIGGIDIELTKREADYLNKFNRTVKNMASTTTQKPCVEGMNNLDGGMACHYARLRKVDDDWVRMDRQRTVVMQTVEKLKGSSFSTLNNLCDMVMPLIQTNLSMIEIAELILYSPKFLESEFDQLEIPIANSYGGMNVMNGGSAWALNFEKNNAVLHDFLYGAEASDVG
jgi:LCP family protein required for cell wall assembly